MAERWIIDAGRPLVLPLSARQGVVRVTEQATPNPPLRTQFAQRPEGSLPTSREQENRTITLRLELAPPTDQWAKVEHDFGAPPTEAQGDGDVPGWRGSVRRVDAGGSAIGPAISDLAAAVGALTGGENEAITGTLTRVLESGERITFDVLQCEADAPTWDLSYFVAGVTSVSLTFTCLPFGRSPERLLGSASLASGKRLVTLDDLVVPGDVPALARIALSGSTQSAKSILYAVDQPDPATRSVGVQLDASTLERMAASTVVTAAGSVATQVVRREAFGMSIQPGLWDSLVMLRRSGAPLDVRGSFRVFARVMCSSEVAVTLRLRWAANGREGGMTVNPAVDTPTTDGWALIDLGLVSVPAGGVLDGIVERAIPSRVSSLVDVVLLVPTGRSAVATASTAPPPQEVTHSDELRPTPLFPIGSAVTGSDADIGGKWVLLGNGSSGTGNANDFLRGARASARTAAASAWRAIGLPAASGGPRDVRMSAFLPAATASPYPYWGAAAVYGNAAGFASLATGTQTANAWAVASGYQRTPSGTLNPTVWVVTPTGRTGKVIGDSVGLPTGESLYMAVRYDGSTGIFAEYATTTWYRSGGTTTTALLPASGMYVGAIALGSPLSTTPAATTEIGGFVAMGSPLQTADQALYPGATAEFASSGTRRAATATGAMGPLARHEGDRPVLPVSGREDRRTRVVLGTVRGALDDKTDASPGDAFTGKVYASPRWLQIPSS